MLYARKHDKNKKGVGELCDCGLNGDFSQFNTKFPSWFNRFDPHCVQHQIRGEKKQCRECKIEEMFWISKNEKGFQKNMYDGTSKFLGVKSVPQPIYSYHPTNGKMRFLNLEDIKKLMNT